MTDSTRGRIVAGVDGSPASWTAVRAAAWEADLHAQDLVLAHGYVEPMPYLSTGRSLVLPSIADLLEGPRAMLADAASRVGALYPKLTVHTELLAGGGASALVQLSGGASLVVVGSRGHGGFQGLSIGSVAAQTAAHASSAVMVIRSHVQELGDIAVPQAGPVMVGVAGSAHDQAALAFAFEEAGLRGTTLIVVHVWWFPPELALRADWDDPYDRASLQTEEERVIAEAVAGWSTRYPDVQVEHRIVHSLNTSYALIEASAAAGLVVVGCRGRGGFAGLVLGSVSRDLIGHAQAPVAVVHNHN